MNGIWKYSHLLPPVTEQCKASLNEGNTPLLRSKRIGPALGLNNLYFKLELLNPTGSYKDRFASSAVSHLLEKQLPFCIATSSGNTGAALAAYCAAVNMKCFLVIVDGAPKGKVRQMQIYGATTLMVENFGIMPGISHEVFSGLQQLTERHNTSVQISAYHYCPEGMAGVQTIAYEIAEALPQTTHLFSPAGGGGLTLAIARGFGLWKQNHPEYTLPRVHCVQPVGNDTIAGPLRNGINTARNVPRSTTSISGLQVPNVIDGNEVIALCRKTGGTGHSVSDDQIYLCQRELALKEGVFSEPAGAVSLAGAIEALKKKEINPDDTVVCLVTGHGFKDPSAAERINREESGQYFSSFKETMAFIEGGLASHDHQIKNQRHS